MPQIYKNAKEVFIWPGPDIEVTALTVQRIPGITSSFKAAGTTKAFLKMPNDDCVRGIRDLHTRPWWACLWVLQEVVLACSATFVCGYSQIRCKVLRNLAQEIKRLDLVSTFRGERSPLDSRDSFTELLYVEVIQNLYYIFLPSNLLKACRQRICLDPRDRVNALMGLIPPYMRAGHTWDPADEVEELYSRFSANMVQYDVFGTFLSLVETAKRDQVCLNGYRIFTNEPNSISLQTTKVIMLDTTCIPVRLSR